MNDETTRAGANPADAAPKMAQSETFTLKATERAIVVATLHLEENLFSAARMLKLCAEVALGPDSQTLAAANTASRILRNQSIAAEALARIARGESRHRTIVEYVDGPHRDTGPKAAPDARLNSKFSSPLPRQAQKPATRPAKAPREQPSE